MNTISRRSNFAAPALLLLATFLLPGLAQAHTGQNPHIHGFFNGLEHPITGLDHICAMLAVGLWAAQRGGRALWVAPLTFVSVMALGGALGISGVQVPFVEEGIVTSVLVLGILIAAAIRLPLAASMLIVGGFAIFHGVAHGAEMPKNAAGLAYGAGFMFSTAFLHVCGISLALGIARLGNVRLIRFAGCAIALCGAYLLLS